MSELPNNYWVGSIDRGGCNEILQLYSTITTVTQEELKEKLEKLEFEREERTAGGGGEVTSSNEILVDVSDTGGHTPTNLHSEEHTARISMSCFTFLC